MKEIWIGIPLVEKEYEVSSTGLIRSVSRIVNHWTGSPKKWIGKVLSGHKSNSGYILMCIIVQGKKTNQLVHRIVAKAFIPNPENKPCVNHKDGDKLNNNADNLEWVTYSENEIHSIEKLGKIPCIDGLWHFNGFENSNAKPVFRVSPEDKNKTIAIYPTLKDAVVDIKIWKKAIVDCCNNTRISYKGYSFRWATKEEYRALSAY